MFDVQHSKRPENDRSQASPQESSKTKQSIQHTGDLTRIPLYAQAWGNLPPPWLRPGMPQQAPQEEEPLQRTTEPTQRKENTTGLPDTLKTGVEQLSGLSMDDVNVHYNSSKPAEVQALAYTQGTDIHVESGQEKHLAHEAWHVVQQMQGRVQPTLQAKGVVINDDQELESEADVMGTRALQMRMTWEESSLLQAQWKSAPRMVQRSPIEGSFYPRTNGSTVNTVIQRTINPDWSAVTTVSKTKSTQVGVYFVTDAKGEELVIKFEQAAAAEAFASEFIRNLGGNAPEVRMEDSASHLIAQLSTALVAKCTPKGGATNKESIEYELAVKLGAFKGKVLIMTKVPGVPMHQEDKPDRRLFQNPRFIVSLGYLAAYDVALANYDRLLMGLNLGNILYDPGSGRTTGIDQTTREKEEIKGSVLVEEVIQVLLDGHNSSKWAQKIAGLIEALYEVPPVNPMDLDTGFAKGILAIEENLSKLGPLMDSPMAREAPAQSIATAERTSAYMEHLKPFRTGLQNSVAEREADIQQRYEQFLKEQSESVNKGKGISSVFDKFKSKFWMPSNT